MKYELKTIKNNLLNDTTVGAFLNMWINKNENYMIVTYKNSYCYSNNIILKISRQYKECAQDFVGLYDIEIDDNINGLKKVYNIELDELYNILIEYGDIYGEKYIYNVLSNNNMELVK